MKELTGRSEFLLKHEGTEKTLDAITREMMTSELGYQLIRSGYINRNFTLYTSIFHGDRVSSAATNFIIHHVERDTMDEYFQLDEDDVDAVIRECGEAALGSQALYNISILDHALSQPRHSVGAQALLTSLTQFGEEQMQFLRAYLTGGSRRTEFVRRLTDISPRTLSQLASMAELDDAARLSLLDSALTSLSPSLRYSVNDELAKILTDRQSELRSVTDGSLSETSATLLSEIFATAHVKIGDLARLSPVVRCAFVDKNLYEITFENLVSTGAAAPSAALDALSATNERVYQYMLMDWGTHEAYIQASKKFKEYMSPQLIGEDLYAFMSSDDIDDEIKDEVIIHSREYAAVGGDAGLLAMARYASIKSLVMPIEVIKRLPAIGAPLEQTLTLLRAHLDTASISELTAVLSEVGGAYAEVTTVGKDRPKVAATDDVRALLDALKRHGIVSSYVSEGDKIRVSKKH